MRTNIYKYTLDFLAGPPEILVSMPVNAKMLKFDVQDDVPTIWVRFEVQELQFLSTRRFVMETTGFIQDQPDNEKREYIGTFQVRASFMGNFVGHVFEIVPIIGISQ